MSGHSSSVAETGYFKHKVASNCLWISRWVPIAPVRGSFHHMPKTKPAACCSTIPPKHYVTSCQGHSDDHPSFFVFSCSRCSLSLSVYGSLLPSLSIYLFVYLSNWQFACLLSICLSICLFIHLSTRSIEFMLLYPAKKK